MIIVHIIVTGNRGNVDFNNSPQAWIDLGTSRFKPWGELLYLHFLSFLLHNTDLSGGGGLNILMLEMYTFVTSIILYTVNI